MSGEKLIRCHDKFFKPFISKEKINEAIDNIANRLNHDYEGKSPIFLIVLNGSIIFGSDLVRRISLYCEIEAIDAKSYGSSMNSSGKVQVHYLRTNFKGKDILVVEDIVDSGLTLSTLMQELWKFEPNSVEAVTLLSKPEMRKTEVDVKYIGIEIPPAFVVGYGLDYAGKGRQFDEIYVVND